MRKLRVSVLMHEDFVPPETAEGLSLKQMAPWKTEYDVLASLEELGHAVEPLGVTDDLGTIRRALTETKPHIVFNVLEEFHGLGSYVPYVLGYLELIRQPYTGCNPYGLMLSRNKALSKQILKHHRVRVPDFVLLLRGRTVRRPRRLSFPLFVKSTTEHGSVGIAQASIVWDDAQLQERVAFIHEQIGTDAIAEQYIDGREFYVGVIGNHRLQVFPVWEMVFEGLPEGAPRIATAKVKWDLDYQESAGITTRAVRDLPTDVEHRIRHICKRVYRLLAHTGYARMDLRYTPEGKIFLLESNANPDIQYGEDFAESAEAAGIGYEMLIQRILNLGMRYAAEWQS
jgi:D-alanine-D-alanine ligase